MNIQISRGILKAVHLVRLKTENFRNLDTCEVCPGKINFVVGDNGAGKTSVLEAIFMLNRGRSFRTSQIDVCIRTGAEHCTVFGEFSASDGASSRIGMERRRNKETSWRLDGRTPRALSELTRVVPLMLITPETLALVSGTPQLRRQFVDAGMFHVEHRVWGTWKRWRLSLQNRNSLLKSGRIDSRELAAWTDVLVETAIQLTDARDAFVQRLDRALKDDDTLTAHLGPVELSYQKGWPRETGYREALEASQARDQEQGYTSFGPHKGDLVIRVNGEYLGPRRYLSRGQQKMVAVALELARLRVIRQMSGHPGIVLLDDVAAELDHINQQRLLKGLLESDAQLFITALNSTLPESLYQSVTQGFGKLDDWKVFHVEHGNLRVAN